LRTLSIGTANASTLSLNKNDDNIVSDVDLPIDMDNAAGLGALAIFDAVADTKFRRHCGAPWLRTGVEYVFLRLHLRLSGSALV